MTDVKPFTLPGWEHDAEPESEGVSEFETLVNPPTTPLSTLRLERPTPEQAHRRKRKQQWVTAIIWVLIVILAAAGALVLYLGYQKQGQPLDAPEPPRAVSVDPDAPIRGATETSMSPEDMAPMHYFIPALDVYSEIVPNDGFESSEYANFDSLLVPDDPAQTAWFSAGGALADNDSTTEGTTLLASHVGYGGEWGVLRYLYTLEGGEIIYIKDAAGKLSAWKMTEMYTQYHTDFPQEYWEKTGDRQLVLVTCAGYDPGMDAYVKNIFAVATPVNPDTLKPFPKAVRMPVSTNTAAVEATVE